MKEVKTILIILVGAGIMALLIFTWARLLPKNFEKITAVSSSSSPSPSPIILKQALPRDAYTIIMVGDSMTESLGPNADKLREYLT